MEVAFQLAVLLIAAASSFGDISHLFLPELNFFQPPYQQHPLPFLYAPPHPPPQSPLLPPPAISATTEFTLPEIIINRQVKDGQHGNFIPLNQYLPPPDDKPSVGQADNSDQIDQRPPPNSGYLPPKPDDPIVVFDEGVHQGYEYEKPASSPRPFGEDDSPLQIPTGLLPPPAVPPFDDRPSQSDDTPASGYHYRPPDPTYLPPPANRNADANSQIRLHVKEMRCLDHRGGFFRSVLKVDSFLGAVPTVDNDSSDPKCQLKLSRSYLVVNVAAEDFQKCGVQHCGKDLCLRLRFPTIRGMRTGTDSILSLHCKTQSKVAVKTHALKVSVSNDLQARSAGVYAHGGSQNEFRTHIELLRKTSNGYTKHLERNGAVQLGEELLLRAHVIAGDGWNYTKLTDVSLQRVSPTGEVITSANLITSRGCVNPSMRNICSQPPHFEPPLGYRLPFKAVMFKGMRSGDEMVLSMRITGCLEHHDCHINVLECSSDGKPARLRRDLGGNSTEISEISKISFRVEVPSEDAGGLRETRAFVNDAYQQRHEQMDARSELGRLVIGSVLGFVAMLCLLGLVVYLKFKRE